MHTGFKNVEINAVVIFPNSTTEVLTMIGVVY